MPDEMSSSLLSAEPFVFYEEGQGEAIAKSIGYCRMAFLNRRISFPSAEHDTVRSSIANPLKLARPGGGFGRLRLLPMKLLHDVLLRTDMLPSSASAGKPTVQQTVDSVHQYQLVSSKLRLSTEFLAEIDRGYEFNESARAQLRCFPALPSNCSAPPARGRDRPWITSFDNTLRLGKRIAGALHAPPDQGIDHQAQLMGVTALPYYNSSEDTAKRGLSCSGCAVAADSWKRGMPLEEGAASDKAKKVMYSRRNLLDHFRSCKPAQSLWMASEGGTRQPPELPEHIKRHLTSIEFQKK